jgi:hypothetical protein
VSALCTKHSALCTLHSALRRLRLCLHRYSRRHPEYSYLSSRGATLKQDNSRCHRSPVSPPSYLHPQTKRKTESIQYPSLLFSPVALPIMYRHSAGASCGVGKLHCVQYSPSRPLNAWQRPVSITRMASVPISLANSTPALFP